MKGVTAMTAKQVVVLSVGVWVFLASAGNNYNAIWKNDDSITIGGVKYSDLLSADVWGVDPASCPSSDNLGLYGSANISISKDATVAAWFIANIDNASYNIDLNGHTLTATSEGRGLRNMRSGVQLALTGGTLRLCNLLWPDRSAEDIIRHDNVFTVTGADTTLDVDNLYFGYDIESARKGQGCGNKVIVTDGAYMAANVNLAWYKSFSGEPNGLYVTGLGTVFSNKNNNATLTITSSNSANSFSNEFVVADGAVVKGMTGFTIGAARALSSGEGHLLAFRGANTSHTFKQNSTLGLSHRFEVDGAAVTIDNVTINNYGSMTVQNGGSIVGKIGQYGTLLLFGQGSQIVSSSLSVMGNNNVPSVRTYVMDRASLSTGNSTMLIAANGCTNASLYVQGGGKVTCGLMSLGFASPDQQYDIAPYGCVLEVSGEGSVVSNESLTVGNASNGNAASFTGCGTNGHDNVVRIMNGGKIYINPNNASGVTIGYLCPSNALEVLNGGVLECGALYIGRMGSGDVGPFKARNVAFDNRCLVSGGTIESTGLLSIRGNNSLCYVTNGVMHTTSTNIFECETNTGYLQIAGTNSLLKGDLAFRISSAGAKIDFVLPKEGYVRAPIQSDNRVSFHGTTVVSFIPPVEAGRIADSYTLAQVPESGTLDVPAELLSSMRTAIAALGERDERFAQYRVKVVVEDGYKRLVARRPGGLIISFR